MRHFFYLFLSIWILITACNDPILVGSVLLENQELDVEFTDQLAVKAKTILGDSSITFRQTVGNTFNSSTYMVGSMDDEKFGKTEVVSYFNPTLLIAYPDFLENPLDSVVITIPLDSIGFYGDLGATHNVELRAITQTFESLLENSDTLYSSQTMEVDPEVLATYSGVVNYTDSTSVEVYTDVDSLKGTIKVGPQLRLKMDNQFWIDLHSSVDSLTAEDLEMLVPGYELRSTASANSMFGLDLSYRGIFEAANINFYYTDQTDTTKMIYQLPLGRYRHSQFIHDYSGSNLESELDNNEASKLYIQALAGTSIEVDLSEATTVNDRILNYAELQFTLEPEDEELYAPIGEIDAWYRTDEGQLNIVGRPTTTPALVESYAGGSRTLSYKIDLTFHLNLIKKGTITNDKIILIPRTKAQRPNRSIILGTNDPDHPLKLNLILTKP